jgi:succinate dehydrogenase/fumarate reductase flavoprotein subunit
VGSGNALLRHAMLDYELDEEVQFHIEMKTCDYIAWGMSQRERPRSERLWARRTNERRMPEYARNTMD